MRTGNYFRVGLIVLALCALTLAVSACGGRNQPSVASLQPSDRSGGLSTSPDGGELEGLVNLQSTDSALAELEALETPDGVDAALFAQLKAELQRQLTAKGVSKCVSAPPTGEANKVADLALIASGNGTFTLQWSYRNVGDYDQNGKVGISDITPIAMHYGETYEPTDENCIQAVVDGSSNLAVDIADITPIAVGFGVDCAGYRIQGGDTPDGAFSTIQSVSLDTATGDGRLFFSAGPMALEHAYIRVAPFDSEGAAGEPSDPVQVLMDSPEIVAVSPLAGVAGRRVNFNAEVTGSLPLTYAWNFGGGAAPNTTAVAHPQVTLGVAGEYDARLTVTNPFGQDVFDFTLTVNPALPEIFSVGPTEGTETYEVRFTAIVTGSEPMTFAWDFGGGASPNTSVETSPSVTLGAPGEYSASLTVTNAAGNDTYPFALTVEPSVPPEIMEVQPLGGYSGEEAAFTAEVSGTPPFTYSWDFAGAVTGADTSAESPAGTWASEGEYEGCSLTVTNLFGNDTYLFTLTVAESPGWAHTWGGSSDERILALAADGSGNIYAAGETSSVGARCTDVLLLKYDAQGNPLWQKTWGGNSYDYGKGVAVDGSGNVYVTGTSVSYELVGDGGYHAILLKYDPSGSLLWQKVWRGAGSGDDYGYSVTAGAGGSVYVAGQTSSFGAGAFDFLLLKYDPDGNLLWQKAWGGSG
jgi:PKD repeat protein